MLFSPIRLAEAHPISQNYQEFLLMILSYQKRVLVCESKSNCVVYSSFMVFSGNVDGSVAVWDLREPFNLHLSNLRKKEFRTEESVVRSPTYSTAGVLLNDNHFSEVKAILALQNKTRNDEKGVFLQLATLELESKLIIWVFD